MHDARLCFTRALVRFGLLKKARAFLRKLRLAFHPDKFDSSLKVPMTSFFQNMCPGDVVAGFEKAAEGASALILTSSLSGLEVSKISKPRYCGLALYSTENARSPGPATVSRNYNANGTAHNPPTGNSVWTTASELWRQLPAASHQ